MPAQTISALKGAKGTATSLFTVAEAARFLGVSPNTLRRWDSLRILSPQRTPGGQRRYSREQLESFLTRQEETIYHPLTSTTTTVSNVPSQAEELPIQEQTISTEASFSSSTPSEPVTQPMSFGGQDVTSAPGVLVNNLERKEEVDIPAQTISESDPLSNGDEDPWKSVNEALKVEASQPQTEEIQQSDTKTDNILDGDYKDNPITKSADAIDLDYYDVEDPVIPGSASSNQSLLTAKAKSNLGLTVDDVKQAVTAAMQEHYTKDYIPSDTVSTPPPTPPPPLESFGSTPQWPSRSFFAFGGALSLVLFLLVGGALGAGLGKNNKGFLASVQAVLGSVAGPEFMPIIEGETLFYSDARIFDKLSVGTPNPVRITSGVLSSKGALTVASGTGSIYFFNNQNSITEDGNLNLDGTVAAQELAIAGGISSNTVTTSTVYGSGDLTLLSSSLDQKGNIYFNGTKSYVNSEGIFTGNGSALTNLDAGKITSGKLSDDRLNDTVSRFGDKVDSGEIQDGTIKGEDLASDTITLDHIADTLPLDNSLEFTLRDHSFNFMVNGSGNINADLQGTGDFVVKNNTNTYFTFNNDGSLSQGATAGNVTLTGSTAIQNTLAVTGATTLGSTLNVSGAAAMSSTLAVTGSTTLNSTLGVTGATTLSSTLGVTGATTLNSTLGVSGASTFLSTIGVDGTATFNGTIVPTSFTGHMVPASDATYDIGSAVAQWRNIYLSGNIFGANFSMTGDNPTLAFTDTTPGDEDWNVNIDGSSFFVRNTTDGANYLSISGTGTTTLAGALVVQGAGGVTLSNTTADVTFGNGESINNDTDGTLSIVASVVNSNGDYTTSFTTLDGSTTSNGTGTIATSLVVTDGTNFNVGNYIKLDSTNCVTGVSSCYAKVTDKTGNTLTISPALTWANGATVTEMHVPEIGATNTASTLNNRFGRGYFIDGIVTGNGTTYYTDSGITTPTGTFTLASGATTLNLPTITTFTASAATGNFDALSIGGGYGSTGVTISNLGAIQMDGNLTVGGTATFAGLVTNNSNTTLGDTAADTITFIGVINSNVVPDNSTRNLGSASSRWATGYFDTISANSISGTVVTGATSNNDWTINSDNATNNAENGTITFERGTPIINAVMQWNASGDAGKATGYDDNFLFNFPISLYSQVSGATQTFTSGSLFKYGQNATHAITQSAAFIGTDIDFSSNITVPNSSSGNQTGGKVTLKDGGASATAIGFQTAGTMDYGLDLDGTIGSADIRLQNDEVIQNITDGTIAFGATTINFSGVSTFTATSATASFDTLNVGGGYGSTGVTVSNAGAISADSNISSGVQFLAANGSAGTPSYSFTNDGDLGFYRSGTDQMGLATAGVLRHDWTGSTYSILHNSATIALGASQDVNIARDAANSLALRNGTNPQFFNVYNTYTDSANYERLVLETAPTYSAVKQEEAGAGTARSLYLWNNSGSDIRFRIGSSDVWGINTSGHLITFTDNTYDIGASTTSRPRNIYAGTSGVFGTSTNNISIIGDASGVPTIYASGSTSGDLRTRGFANQYFQIGATDEMTLTSTGLGITGGNLGVGAAAVSQMGVRVAGSITASSANAIGVYSVPTLNAAANGDTLSGVYVNPTYSAGAFTGTTAYGVYIAAPSGAASNIGLYNAGTTTLVGQLNTGAIVSSNGIGILGGNILQLNNAANDAAANILNTGGAGASVITFRTASTDRFAIGSSGSIYIADTSNANMTQGLTINQGASDDEIFTLKSSDIAHGTTTATETDTYGTLSKISAASGGLLIRGFTEATIATYLSGIGITDNTTKSTSGVAYNYIDTYKQSGTSTTTPGTNANILAIASGGNTQWLLDAEGDVYQSGLLYPGAGSTMQTSNYLSGDADGVGINTTNPAYALDVVGQAQFTHANGIILNRTSVGSAQLAIDNVAGTADFKIVPQTNNSGIALQYKTSGGTTSTGVYVEPTGDIGIGTTNPATKLDTYGTIRATRSDATSQYLEMYASGGSAIFRSASGVPLEMGVNGTHMTIDTAGEVGIGTTAPNMPLSIQSNSSGDGVSIWGRNNGVVDEAGLYFRHNDGSTAHGSIIGESSSLRLSSNSGSNALVIEQGGNVGIGTTDPAYKFDVTGYARVTEGINVGASTGATNGQVWTSSSLKVGHAFAGSATAIFGDTGTEYWTIGRPANSPDFKIRSNAVDNVLYATNAGLIGIGTSSPGASFDLSSTATTTYAQRITANSLTTGTALQVTATGLTTGSFFDINNGSSIFNISQSGVTTSLPVNFNGAGDVNIAYDLNFTNQTSSYIKSNAPLYFEAGESFESNDLTLRTFNSGDVVFDAAGGLTSVQAQAWTLNATSTTALNIVNSAGTSLFNVDTTNSRIGIGTSAPGATLQVNATGGAANIPVLIKPNSNSFNFLTGQAYGSTNNVFNLTWNNNDDADFIGYSAGVAKFELKANGVSYLNGGNVGIGDTSPASLFTVGNGDLFQINSSGQATFTSSLDPAIKVTNDTGFLKIVGGSAGSESGANIMLFGKSHANTGMFHVGTPRADGAAELQRFAITGMATTANAYFMNSNVGIGMTNPSFKLDVGQGSFRAADTEKYYLTRTTSTTSSDWVEIGTITPTQANQPLNYKVTINQHSNEHQYSETFYGTNFVSNTTDWVQIAPATGFAWTPGRSIALEAQRGADIYTVKLRIRNLQGHTSAGTAYITVETTNGNLTASSATGNGGSLATGYAAGNSGWFFPVQSAAQVTNSTSGMFINSNGNVGIGTTAPNRQVQVLGSGQLTAALTDAGNTGGTLNISHNSGTAGAGGALLLSALNDSGTYLPQVAIKALLTNGSTNGVGDLAFSTRNAVSDTALTERMRITNTGNAMIGASDFTNAKLGVLGEMYVGDSSTHSGSGSGGVMVRRAGADSARYFTMINEGSVTHNISAGGSGQRTDLVFSNDASGDYIFNTGNVGIGLTSPETHGGKLVVASTSSGARTTGLNLVNAATAVNTAVSLDFTPNSNIPLARINALRTDTGGGGTTDFVFSNYKGAAATLKEYLTLKGDTGNLSFANENVTGTGTSSSINLTANSLTTGTAFYIGSTSMTTGKFADFNYNGSSVFSVSQTDVTTSLPVNFTSPGDVSIAYDLNFTNPTASYIKSAAPLYVVAGETFGSSNLVLQAYNAGDVVIDSPGGVTLNQAQQWMSNVSSTTALNVTNSAGTSILDVDTTNTRVGINDSTPDATFDVDGTVRSEGANNMFYVTGGGGGASGWIRSHSSNFMEIGTSSSSTISFMTASTHKMGLDTNGQLTLPVTGTSAGIVLGSTNTVTLQDSPTVAERAGTARRKYTIDLTPEITGATLTADGSSNTGDMTSDFCSGSSLRSINTSVCGASEEHNYYAWTTTQGSAQDYDIWVRVQLPQDFSAWTTSGGDGATVSARAYGWRTDSTNNNVTIAIYDTAGVSRGTANVSTGTAAWTQNTFLDSTTGTWTAGGYITIQIKMTADSNDTVRLGEIELNYLSKFK